MIGTYFQIVKDVDFGLTGCWGRCIGVDKKAGTLHLDINGEEGIIEIEREGLVSFEEWS